MYKALVGTVLIAAHYADLGTSLVVVFVNDLPPGQ